VEPVRLDYSIWPLTRAVADVDAVFGDGMTSPTLPLRRRQESPQPRSAPGRRAVR
jgi:hypothetical protein